MFLPIGSGCTPLIEPFRVETNELEAEKIGKSAQVRAQDEKRSNMFKPPELPHFHLS